MIAAAAEATSTQSSNFEWNTPVRQPFVRQTSVHAENTMEEGVGWGTDNGMSPARTTRTRDEEEDLYGEPMQVEEEEEEEVPPTQQERYQGIFE